MAERSAGSGCCALAIDALTTPTTTTDEIVRNGWPPSAANLRPAAAAANMGMHLRRSTKRTILQYAQADREGEGEVPSHEAVAALLIHADAPLRASCTIR